MKRVQAVGVEEVILALDSTLEGDATALFLKEEFKRHDIKVSRLALGLPVGSSLDFIDEGTLSQALSGRQVLQKNYFAKVSESKLLLSFFHHPFASAL